MEWIYEANRIYSKDSEGELLAEITFPAVDASTVDIDHTYVSKSLRGQGIADRLMQAATTMIREKGLKARISCPYAIKWMNEHPEQGDIRA